MAGRAGCRQLYALTSALSTSSRRRMSGNTLLVDLLAQSHVLKESATFHIDIYHLFVYPPAFIRARAE